MGQINSPSNLLDRIKRAEDELRRMRAAIGLASATITRGGLTLLKDAFLRMVDDNDTQILYFGPDSQGRQIIRIRREGGSDVMWTGFTAAGNQFWRLTDRFNRELFSDDTETGGIARPWLPVVLYPLFLPTSTVSGYWTVETATVTESKVLWEGRIPLVSHPRIAINGVWGAINGSTSATYELIANNTVIGTWTETALIVGTRGPFPLAPLLDATNVSLQLRVTGTGGTGRTAVQLLACYTRQT
ncbi:hypothetical protein [Umezawaea beigongshangensis]|uniref:hypothetical protein n=1 Tax=Umezawaea beigongshangensis TaxID=2780383 RepID=UPI0018F1305A|nr:hypothetical protein [Umezawaea beigongshangensis]